MRLYKFTVLYQILYLLLLLFSFILSICLGMEFMNSYFINGLYPLRSLLRCSKCPRVGPWKPFQGCFCVLLAFLELFHAFWYNRMCQAHLTFSLPCIWNQLFLYGALISFLYFFFSGIWYLEIKVCVLGMLITPEVSLLPDPLNGHS